jgi:thymidylate kinase
MNYVKQILDGLFESFERLDIPYCVLHGYETLPESAPSDVDIAIDPKQKEAIDAIIYRLAAETGSVVTQKLYYDIPHCYYYVICHASDNKIDIVQLDFLIDHIGINKYFFTSEELIKRRKRFKTFYIPETSTEAIYLLLKKLVKAKFYREHRIKLKELYLEESTDIENKIVLYFGGEKLPLIKNIILENEEVRKEDVRHLQKSFQRRNIGILKKTQRMFWLARRFLYRIKNPTGMFVVILSPDGGGKTSVSRGIIHELTKSFRRTRYLYWRPGLLPELRDLLKFRFKTVEARTNPDPHGRIEQGRFVSFVRFLYYASDYILGYFKVRFLRTITTLIVMDRYYYDFLIDKKRYGFRVPDWVPRMLSRMIPKPDLVIYLDNDAEDIYARKQELSLDELRRQVEAFRKLSRSLPCAYTINTKKSLEEVIHESSAVIIQEKARKLKGLLNL